MVRLGDNGAGRRGDLGIGEHCDRLFQPHIATYHLALFRLDVDALPLARRLHLVGELGRALGLDTPRPAHQAM